MARSNLSKLFVKEDVTEAVKEKAIGLEGRVSEMLGVIGLRKCPQVDIGPHCESPYSCPLGSICWGEVEKVENNIFTLRRAGAKAWSLYQGGIIDNEDIPSDLDLSETQRTQLEVERTNKPHVRPSGPCGLLETTEVPSLLA